MELYIDANAPVLVLAAEDGYASGAEGFHAGTDASVFRLSDVRHLVTLLPAYGDGGALRSVTVGLEPSGSLTSPCPHCRTIDWGGGTVELCADLPPIPQQSAGPALLERLNFPGRDGRRRTVDLYCDNGIRLNVGEGGGERSFVLCAGSEAGMRVLDVGRERLLIVHAKDGGTERLIALEGNFEVAASIEGKHCAVDDGYLTAIAPLGTVLGHERRTRYEFRAGRLERLPDEVGFFSRSPVFPHDAAGIALALMEAVKLGRGDEAERLMGAELNAELELSDLRGFFGEFDECRLAPWQGIGGQLQAGASVVCGAVSGGRAKKFTFTAENGRITDITEDDGA